MEDPRFHVLLSKGEVENLITALDDGSAVIGARPLISHLKRRLQERERFEEEVERAANGPEYLVGI